MEPVFSIRNAVQRVNNQIAEAVARRPEHFKHEVCLVAVSKIKPKECIIEAYKSGVRHFGENYVHELSEKSKDVEIRNLCPEIRWHFIGHLQANKVNKLLTCHGLYRIECIDSIRIADLIQKAAAKLPEGQSMEVLIQVNTSREESKSGIMPENALDLARHIVENCPNLKLHGLMTIGALSHDIELGPNPDYVTLQDLKEKISKELQVDLSLSMGTSHDFEHAIECGSSYVRVGEKIFGPRPKK